MIIKVLDSSFDLYLEKNKDVIYKFKEKGVKLIIWDVLGFCSHYYADYLKYYSRSSITSPENFNLYVKYKNQKFTSGAREFVDLFQMLDLPFDEFNKLNDLKKTGMLYYDDYEFVKNQELCEYMNLKSGFSEISKKMMSVKEG